MKIKKYYLTKSDNTRRMEKMELPQKIILKSSKYNGFSCLKNRNIIEMSKYRDDREFSCHYIVGVNGEIINIIPENEKAICSQNIDIDSDSIGIMLCLDKDGEFTKKELISLKGLIKRLREKYNIKREAVLTEYEINGARRPGIFVDEPILLEDLLV